MKKFANEPEDVNRQQRAKEIANDDEFNTHDASFRRHYQLNYADDPRSYGSFYSDAYRFGYDLGVHKPDLSWEQVESFARNEWTANHAASWTEIAEAVRYGWTEERDPDKLQVHHYRDESS